ncbi:MAG TPA: LLM class F420-dependent oxidoreductase [Spongiibacteraceae bacterium]|nr:LLM class F420-dependent oxidoreductase [Spongiibacteraceae bacterium]HCS28019.1 LLM class F420-dependent oxidoreductase [Spongiibacteraceae bacterium]
MKFWQMLHWVEPDQLLPIAQFAEELGFEGVMLGDHAVYPEVVNTVYPYSPDGKPPMTHASPYPDCWIALGMIAAVTSRLKLSVSVYVLPLRNPIEVAKATGTLAVMSNNRVVLGAGSGWMKEEFDAYGVDFRRRGKRLDECMEIARKIWTGDMVSHAGSEFQFDACRVLPAPSQPVPIYLGGVSAPALRRTAEKADGWIGNGTDPDDVPGVLAQLQKLRAAAGRDHLPFETVIGLTRPANVDTLKRLRDAGMTAGCSAPFMFSLGPQSSLDEKRRLMEQFAKDYIQPLQE